ncbi:PadR family transcriptional regulator [Rhodococcus tibetensis]|uniref:PadR family transcriptional regulator n=1 Tax=Rhodococcus tibetensis TaxID=2965064 RepID=A0ABT1QFL4_9NOCA|nr:PadR family transcriptional regulator [Rhodococcus sp. FXJ9.536]MCQ4121079.1 PadR family transcriptional regulator [Rhodococcus sp. FXJ9.536]
MDTEWPSDWLRGVLGPMVLAIVSEGETYGYVVATRLAEAGMGTVKGGTLYPILNRLERDGALQSQWRQGEGGPGRKYYTVTAAGMERLDRQRAQWQSFTQRASGLLGTERSTS